MNLLPLSLCLLCLLGLLCTRWRNRSGRFMIGARLSVILAACFTPSRAPIKAAANPRRSRGGRPALADARAIVEA